MNACLQGFIQPLLFSGPKLRHVTKYAGFAYKGDVFGADEAATTIGVNYRGTRAVCEAVQPLLTKNARIVNVSSRSGLLKILQSDQLRQKADAVSSLQAVDELADDFVARVKADK